MTNKSVLLAHGGPARYAVLPAIDSRGYDCFSTRDGLEAFASFTLALSNPPPFDLLVCGMNLPGLSGPELVNRVISLDPFCPIIIVSEPGEFTAARSAILGGSWEFLREPLEEGALPEAIDRLLEKSRTAREEAHTFRVINSLIKTENTVKRRNL